MTVSSPNAEAERLDTQKASRLIGGALRRQRPLEISATSGVMAMWLLTMKMPANRPSAASLAPKTTERPMGSGIRTRKSVSSGKSEWLTRTVTSATIHIGSAIASVVSASSARAYGSAVAALKRAPYAFAYIRTSSKPTAMKNAIRPMMTRTNESAPSCEKTPKSKRPRKK